MPTRTARDGVTGRGRHRRLPEAERGLTESIRLDPADPNSHQLLGRLAGALRELEAGMAIAPNFAKCRADLGMTLVATGDRARGQRELRAARAAPAGPRDALWRGAAASALAQELAAGEGGAAEGLALLDEASAAGVDWGRGLAAYLRTLEGASPAAP